MDTTNNGSGAPQGSTPTPTPPPQQSGGAPGGSDNNMLMGILAYLGILVLIPLFVEKNNPFVKFHVKQGLVLFAIEVAVYVLMMTLYMLAPILGIVNLACLVLAILGIVNVVQKAQKELPVVGQFAKHFEGLVK